MKIILKLTGYAKIDDVAVFDSWANLPTSDWELLIQKRLNKWHTVQMNETPWIYAKIENPDEEGGGGNTDYLMQWWQHWTAFVLNREACPESLQDHLPAVWPWASFTLNFAKPNSLL